jgi:hypothetical protein
MSTSRGVAGDDNLIEGGPWALSGTYLEACNCEVICPCRRVGGRQGGRSTYGICLGALSWQVVDGHAGGTDLSGSRVVLVCRYDDDEPGSPWDFVLYLGDEADDQQRAALEAIYMGKAGGTPLKQFPWAFKPSRPAGVRVASIEIDHTPRKGWFRVGEDVTVRVAEPVPDQEPVTCVIPGHHQTGLEVYVDEQRSSAPPIEYAFSGRCGYEASFAYSSDD